MQALRPLGLSGPSTTASRQAGFPSFARSSSLRWWSPIRCHPARSTKPPPRHKRCPITAATSKQPKCYNANYRGRTLLWPSSQPSTMESKGTGQDSRFRYSAALTRWSWRSSDSCERTAFSASSRASRATKDGAPGFSHELSRWISRAVVPARCALLLWWARPCREPSGPDDRFPHLARRASRDRNGDDAMSGVGFGGGRLM